MFFATFRDILKIGNHGSNSHLAPDVSFGNDSLFSNELQGFLLIARGQLEQGLVGPLSADFLQNPCKSWCSRPNLRRRSEKTSRTLPFATFEDIPHRFMNFKAPGMV